MLQRDLERHGVDKQRIEAIEHQDEEEAELEEIQVKQLSAVELMTIVGAKGLSADHVIIIGFDNVNMNWVISDAAGLRRSERLFEISSKAYCPRESALVRTADMRGTCGSALCLCLRGGENARRIAQKQDD